jgi:ribosomal protein S18 acetylase RimI-like enzyme
MIRELRKADGPRVLELLKTQFPEEEAILGTRPEGVQKLIDRVFRWDARLVVGLARLFGRPIYRFFVVEEDGRLVATTILSFPERSGYVSMVVVDPAYRRRGLAQALLERARVATDKSRRKFISLDVLEQNAPARALYERIGYRPLRETGFFVRDPGAGTTGAPSSMIRPFRKSDIAPLLEIARRSVPPEVERVLPLRAAALRSTGFMASIFANESAAWVVDRGRGPEAYVEAVATPMTEAGHCSNPIIGEDLDPETAVALVRTAVDWSTAHNAPRMIASVPASNVRGRAALEGGGFHAALTVWTLYRSVP